jgi:hypothetical protein
MVNNIQCFISNHFDISIKIIKGQQEFNNNKEYNYYNVSILLSYLLNPTKKYGVKSIIHRLHNCTSTNRVQRLNKQYNNNSQFKLFIDNLIKLFYNSKYATTRIDNSNS